MQMELENLVWDRKKLDEKLKKAIKERRLVESLLAELEDEHDEVISKMELLEIEVILFMFLGWLHHYEFEKGFFACFQQLHHLKTENQHLKEGQEKSFWSSKDNGCQHVKDGSEPSTSSPKCSYEEDGYTGEGMRRKDDSEDENKDGSQMQHVNKTLLKERGPAEAYSHDADAWHNQINNIIVQRREVALSRSFFSAMLSLLVGVIIWEAKDPCMPLIIALFAVAVISLKTVLMFLSTIGNKPAMDAVALLSFNWFMLGLLAYPTLPVFAHFLLPLIFNVLERIAK